MQGSIADRHCEAGKVAQSHPPCSRAWHGRARAVLHGRGCTEKAVRGDSDRLMGRAALLQRGVVLEIPAGEPFLDDPMKVVQTNMKGSLFRPPRTASATRMAILEIGGLIP